MEDAQRLKIQHVAAMAHQEIFIQLNIHTHVRSLGADLWLRRAKKKEHLGNTLVLHPERNRQFGIYDQLMAELRREDPRSFQ